MAQALNNYGFATLMNGIPTYLNDVQGLPLDKVRLQRSAKRWSPGYVNAAGKTRQKQHNTHQTWGPPFSRAL